jgi:uncharacterized protein YqgV (UPF0045/DUF77 family)
MRPLGKVAACEISFLPVESSDGIGHVNKVIELIKKSELEHSIGAMSTLVRGDRDKVFQLLKEIYANMDGKCSFVITAKISNICGCNS